MFRDVDPYQVTLPLQQLLPRDLRCIGIEREREGAIRFYDLTKQIHHATLFGGTLALTKADGAIHSVEQHMPFAIAQRIHCTALISVSTAPFPTMRGSTRVQ